MKKQQHKWKRFYETQNKRLQSYGCAHLSLLSGSSRSNIYQTKLATVHGVGEERKWTSSAGGTGISNSLNGFKAHVTFIGIQSRWKEKIKKKL